MVARTGANTFIGAKLGSTFGTAVALSTGDKMEVESLNHGENVETLEASPIGSGLVMQNDSQRGAASPSIEIESIAKFDDPGVALLKQFMGRETVNVGGSGSYTHSLMVNETFNAKWATVAFHGFSAGVFEYPSAAVQRVEITAEPYQYLKKAFDLLANKQLITGTENDAAELALLTAASSYRVVVEPDDEFQINTQGGSALSTSDRLKIRRLTLTMDKPLEHVHEIKGVSGNGEPISSGNPPLSATLQVELRNLEDFTYFTAFQAGTEYKALFSAQGPLIGGSAYYKYQMFFPRLVQVEDPQYDLTEAGENPMIITFKALVAASIPGGMFDTYPHFCIINTKSTVY